MIQDFFHVLNPSQKHRGAVRRFFRKHPKFRHIWIDRTSHPTHLETVIQWARDEGHHHLAVWGGDGTLSRVVQALFELNAFGKITIALIPAGTCNDFGRALALPPWKRYARAMLSRPGYPRYFDVGLVSTSLGKRVFVNNSGFGRTAKAITGHGRSNPLKDIAAFTPKQLDLEWEKDGAHYFESRPGILAVVCNAPFFNKGMHFDKSVEPDDGVLTAFFEDPQPKTRLLLKFARSRLGFALADATTFRVESNSIFVESNEELYPQVDGEPAGAAPVRAIQYSILPKTLRFMLWR